jgi:hypothetical protein
MIRDEDENIFKTAQAVQAINLSLVLQYHHRRRIIDGTAPPTI